GPGGGERPRAWAGDHLHPARSLHLVQSRLPRRDADHGSDEVEIVPVPGRRAELDAVTLPRRALSRRPGRRAGDAARGADSRAGPGAEAAGARNLPRGAHAPLATDGA